MNQAVTPQPKNSGVGKFFLFLGVGCLGLIILSVVLTVGGCVGGGFFLYSKVEKLIEDFKSGPVCTSAIEKMEANPTLQEKMGSNIEFKSFSSVSVNSTNGNSAWRVIGVVKGSTGKEGTATVQATEGMGGSVQFTSLTVYVDGKLVDVLADEAQAEAEGNQ